MSRAHTLGLLGATVLVTLATTSCTAALELDRFRKEEPASVGSAATSSYFDVQFSAKNMQSHISEHFEIRVVDKNDAVQAKAVYDDIVNPDFSLYLGRIVPKTNAPYRLDFWADHNNSGKYDGVVGGINEKDHAWRRVLAAPLPDDVRLVAGRYELDFLHDTVFVDINTDLAGNKIPGTDTLLPFSLTVLGGGAFVGKPVETRIVEKGSRRLVGFHRQGRARDPYDVHVGGILDEETAYEISVYVDVNGDCKYQSDEPSWKLDVASNAAGVASQLDLSRAPRAPIDTGEP